MTPTHLESSWASYKVEKLEIASGEESKIASGFSLSNIAVAFRSGYEAALEYARTPQPNATDVEARDQLADKVQIPYFAKSFSERAGYIAVFKDGWDQSSAHKSQQVEELVKAIKQALSIEVHDHKTFGVSYDLYRIINGTKAALEKFERSK